MKIYKKYLFSNFAKYFLLILFSITSVIWITRVLNYLKFITDYGLSLKNFILIISLLIPNMLIITTPISIILTTIFALNKLIKNNEIVVLQNFGVKKKEILFPLFLVNTIITFIMFYITFFLLSYVNLKFEQMRVLMKNDITNLVLENNDFNTVKNLTFFAQKDEDEVGRLNNFILYVNPINKNDNEKIIYANEADIRGNLVLLKNGNIQEYIETEKDKIKILFFSKYSIDLRDFYTVDLSINNSDTAIMNINQLTKLFKTNRTNAIIGELIERISIPLIGFLLSIFAGISVLNIKFSRLSSAKELSKIYITSIGFFGFLLYLVKLCRNGTRYISLLVVLLSFIATLTIISFNRKEHA